MEFKRKVVVTSVLAGVLPSAYMVSGYGTFKNPEKNRQTIKVLGFILSILSYALAIFLSNRFFAEIEYLESNRALAFGLSVLLLIAVQSLATIAFIKVCEKIHGKAFFTSHKNIKNGSARISFIVWFIFGLLITTFLIAFGPFMFIFSSIYFIPNVYVHHKIKQISSGKKQTMFLTVFFTLLVLMFPVSLFLSGQIENNWVKLITKTGFYYAPFLLYLVLLYLPFDLIKFIISKASYGNGFEQIKERSKKIIFPVFVISAMLIVTNGAANFNTPAVQEYDIKVPGRSTQVDQLRIAMAADFHFSEVTSNGFVEDFIEEINRLDADIVLFAGDIFESNRDNEKLNFIKQELTKIESKYGVYAVEGNHGYYRDTNSEEFFRSTGITLLKDTVISIDQSFQIMGRMDKHNRNRKSVEVLMEQSRSDLPLITMDHQPYYEGINFEGIDIYLSGHTHNGQLFPFNLIEKFIYELPWGYKKIDNTHCFVTCGAQGWGPQVRTGSQSEIMLINAKFEND